MKRLHLIIYIWAMLTLTAVAQPQRYADHSVLASGQWVKIRIPATGIYTLTDSLLTAAGLGDAPYVKVYGYGGALQPEKLTADYLQQTDDLREVAQYVDADGRRLFFGTGPLNWESPTALKRTLNTYSLYGYYFLTAADEQPLTLDSTAFVDNCYPHPNDYHSLYEVDDYSWYDGGRNFFDRRLFGQGVARDYHVAANDTVGTLLVRMSYDDYCVAEVLVGDSLVGTIEVSPFTTTMGTAPKAFPDSHSVAAVDEWTFAVSGLTTDNTVTIRQLSGGNMRLDYLTLTTARPRPFQGLSADCAVPELVGTMSSQDLHGDGPADMVIIIPANRTLADEAERLAQLHREMDGLRVRVVAADELYNEFSSGTPDVNAYRRYMKMLYDRAATAGDRPRYLLLLGDGAWDNRLHLATWQGSGLTPDDLLLCYESDNSFSVTQCYVSDDYFCLLDDGEGDGLVMRDRGDVAVGRLPAVSAQDAKALVDKVIAYRQNSQAGPWQNLLFFMGDDGDNNRHMRDCQQVVDSVMKSYTGFDVKRVYWDAYKRVYSSVGPRYPDVERIVKQQMNDGALVMNYSGHGTANDFSHEYVVNKRDFAESVTDHLPLWVTASCDIMPFDGLDTNIGEVAMLNPRGGAIAFFGTTRTVYAAKNMPINRAFMHYVLGTHDDGRRITIGEAARMAKNNMLDDKIDFAENKLQYTLLGDPALTLAAPVLTAVIDSIGGVAVGQTGDDSSSDNGDNSLPAFTAGQVVTVVGHVKDQPTFCGRATLTVKDAVVHVVGRRNEGQTLAFEYDDRPNTLYVGTDSVADGRFTFTFVMPLEMSYSDQTGQMLVYAVNNERTLTAHGISEDFLVASGGEAETDGDGPEVQCYLDTPDFHDGDTTNATPYFYAQLYDEDGINATDVSFGHHLELTIDGDPMRTYTLNDYFVYNYGDYRRGEVGFSIPRLPDGPHQLTFRAWDMLNHSTVVTLAFVVDAAYDPSGIRSVFSDDWFGRRRTMMQGRVYDAAGRYVGTEVPQRPGIYVFRSDSGVMKKILVKNNK